MMKNWRLLIQGLLNDGAKVAIVSGGLQQTAEICGAIPSGNPWVRRWGGIDRHWLNALVQVMIHVYRYLLTVLRKQ